MRMPDLDRAADVARRLRDVLAAEIAGARGERLLLSSLDSQGLFARAAQRASFLSETARLERALAEALAELGEAVGCREVTLERLRAHGGDGADELAGLLSQARALARALRDMDRLHLELARRAMAVVRGYVEALQPTTSAYDRLGTRASAPAPIAVSSKG